MDRLFGFSTDEGYVPLAIEGDAPESQNIFTVIVGKNGVGKSRLLSAIARDNERRYNPVLLNLKYSRLDGLSKVIAVSTSPFDKFPVNRRTSSFHDTATNYRYVGMRGEGPFGASNAVSLLSSAARGWLEKLSTFSTAANLVEVFSSLNFEPYAEFVFKPGYIGKSINKPQARPYGSEISHEIENLFDVHNISFDERYLIQLTSFNQHEREDIYSAMVELQRYETSRKAVMLAVDFNSGSFFTGEDHSNGGLAKAILTLQSAGLMRLMDVRLIKKNYGPMSLKRASSGEQCLLVIMLGIAGHITDFSTILIDEPEISLHPRWQEEFIRMLISAFSSYRGCQFLIATHSPQVISRLKREGCYITSLTDNKIFKGSEFSHRSADYQLAELFDAPGIMNEYIARIAFSLLAKVKAAKFVTLDNERELEQLKILIENVDSDDPTLDLVNSVIQVCEIYANN
ncbi:ATP-binding protein [Pseudomonas sp. PS01301]|uniref:AAA family ATPase n=1 Tax=Pseudomonas sp. PS01301 TaxID=2991437 RepID=UPI00249A3BD3|nr:ATP-binding protein [Pseudomonas sp. PS01301]